MCLFLKNEAEIWCDALSYYTSENFKTHQSFFFCFLFFYHVD